MLVTQIDNRRLRRARARTMGWGVKGAAIEFGEFMSAHKQFFYLLDKQSARLAKRLGRKEWAGVPAMKEGKTDFQIAQIHARGYVWQTPGQQYFYYTRLGEVIRKVYPEVWAGHNTKDTSKPRPIFSR